MRTFGNVISTALAFMLVFPGLVSAQAGPGEDRLTFSVYAGGFLPRSDVQVGGDFGTFDEGGTYGGGLTWWVNRNFGLRASAGSSSVRMFASKDGTFTGEEPDIIYWAGELVVRFPVDSSPVWYPYLVGGVAAKRYDFKTLEQGTDVGGSFGAGAEVRFGDSSRWGLHTEVRSLVSGFERFGFDDTVNDLVLTGGVSVSL